MSIEQRITNSKIIKFVNKRPISMCALICVAEILSVIHYNGLFKYVILLLCMIAMFTFLRRKGIAVFMSVICLWVFISANMIYNDSILYENVYEEGSFTVQVVSYADKDSKKVQYVLKPVKSIDKIGLDKNDKILLSVYDTSFNINVGDIYEIYGELAAPKANTTPHTFNYKNYLLSRHIKYVLTADAEGVVFRESADIPFHYDGVLSLREDFEKDISEKMSKNAARLLKGIMFASDDVNVDVLEDFSTLGVSHVLAVSGLHVGIIYSFFMFIFSCLKIRSVKIRRLVKLLAGTVIFVYIALSGFSVSCIRAAFMVFVSSLAEELPNMNRRYDTVNTLSIILIISVLFNPFVILGASFILSYIAVLSIAFINPVLINQVYRLKRKGKVKLPESIRIGYPVSIVSVSLSVQAGMLLVNLIMFGRISLLAPLYNLIIVPIISFALILGIISFILPPFAYPILGACDVLLNFSSAIARILAKYDLASVSTHTVSALSFVVYYLALLAVTSYIDVKNKRTVFMSLAILTLALSVTAMKYMPEEYSTVSFMDVGFGDCAIIRTKDNDCIIIDGGGGFYGGDTANEVILPYLYGEGIRKIDMIIATHSDADHMGGIVGLIGEFPIDTIYANDDGGALYYELKAKAEINGVDVKSIYAGESVIISDCIFNILSPDKDREYPSQNDCSIVTEAIIDGVKILFTGDAHKAAEETILEGSETYTLKYDILKSAHHGSLFATEDFELRLYTDVCVISVGSNGYGLPKQEYINSLASVGVKCLRTDEYGLVKIVATGNGSYDIMNYIGSWREVR